MTNSSDKTVDRSRAAPPRKSLPATLLQAAMILLATGVVLSGTRVVALGDTANSRLATVYSLVHQGTWRIDSPETEEPNPFEPGTVDKVMVNGVLLSSKPPVLPLLMAAEYAILNQVWDYDIRRPEDLKFVVWFMTLTLIVSSYVLALVYFARLLTLFVPNPWSRLFPLAALAFATQLPGFATEINNHVPGAALVLISLYYAIGLLTGGLPEKNRYFFCFGLAGGLVFALDMPPTIFVAVFGLWLLKRFPGKAPIWVTAGVLCPLIPHFAAMILSTGSPLPVQLNQSFYLYENSIWRNPLGLDALNEPKWTYLFHLTLGRHGIFLLFPVLATGLGGMLWAVARPGLAHRDIYLAITAAVMVLTVYYVLKTNNYGGASYGFRWFIPAMGPLLLLGSPFFNRARSPWRVAAMLLLLLPALYSAWECYQQPWGVEEQEWPSRTIFGPRQRSQT